MTKRRIIVTVLWAIPAIPYVAQIRDIDTVYMPSLGA